jgi:hypothetical protein
MKRWLPILMLLVLVTWFTLGLTEQRVWAGEVIKVQLKHNAFLVDNGNAVGVTVTIKCAPVGEVIEAIVYVIQDDEEYNESQWGGVPVICDNRTHKHVALAPAYEDMPFHSGKATATVFIVLENHETGESWSGGDFRAIQIR